MAWGGEGWSRFQLPLQAQHKNEEYTWSKTVKVDDYTTSTANTYKNRALNDGKPSRQADTPPDPQNSLMILIPAAAIGFHCLVSSSHARAELAPSERLP